MLKGEILFCLRNLCFPFANFHSFHDFDFPFDCLLLWQEFKALELLKVQSRQHLFNQFKWLLNYDLFIRKNIKVIEKVDCCCGLGNDDCFLPTSIVIMFREWKLMSLSTNKIFVVLVNGQVIRMLDSEWDIKVGQKIQSAFLLSLIQPCAGTVAVASFCCYPLPQQPSSFCFKSPPAAIGAVVLIQKDIYLNSLMVNFFILACKS